VTRARASAILRRASAILRRAITIALLALVYVLVLPWFALGLAMTKRPRGWQLRRDRELMSRERLRRLF
jgi:hypothetical protein